jgi:hypothetical protein
LCLCLFEPAPDALSTKIAGFWKIAECPKGHQELKSCGTIAKDHAMVKFPEPLAGSVETGARYAIYFAPGPDTALHALGSRWLGRDSISGALFEQPALPGVDPARVTEVTADPRRYGFHATLKPPFHLKPDTTHDALFSAAEAFAGTQDAFEINLSLRQFSGFFALMQSESPAETRTIAAATVSELDAFRALPSERQLERRREANLSGAQETLLQRWGYPYVMNEFRFHMTLTHRITDDAEADLTRQALKLHFADVLGCQQWFDSIAVFSQDVPDAPFQQIARFALRSPP